MTPRLYASTEPITGHVGLGLWLQHEISNARKELAEDGKVSDETWATIDGVTDALIEAMPADPPLRR